MILMGLSGTPDLPEAGACDSGRPMSQSFLTIPKNTEIDSGAGMCSKKGQQSHLVESLRKRGSLSPNQDHGRYHSSVTCFDFFIACLTTRNDHLTICFLVWYLHSSPESKLTESRAFAILPLLYNQSSAWPTTHT